MSPFEQGGEFSGSSRQAKELVERLRRSAARSEEFEKAAETDRRLAARQKGQASEEARSGTARNQGGPLSQDEAANLDAINSKFTDRIALEERIIANQRIIEQNAQRQLRAYESNPSFLPAGSSRGLETLAGGGYGGGAPPRQPPRFFRQPEEPQEPQRRLGAGQQPIALLPEKAESYYTAEAKQAREFAAAQGEATIASKGLADSQETLGPFIEHNTEYMRAANLEFTRFGALSSEWIGAAARGATTMQELGRQTTATIGKFGGWLAAGSLVFGALDAVRAIGKGAIESSTGVNQLQRVIKQPGSLEPAKLQKAFRAESQHFNLPIEDVTEAAYEMGKVFKTQDEALAATKAVLYSVKVGELDVATASRYLIAIINGFHLPANQLVGVFDMLNNAQNEFGISISDVEGGLAKASGSFNAATTKGSPLQKYHELLALVTTAQKATGQTGQVVGTAIQRAPNFLRQDKNKEILKKYGIDAGGDLNDVIVQGFEKSQSLSGHKIAELASAIFGPQYGARIGTPLFQQFELYQKVLAKTGPKASKGSGETELQTQLGSISEKIKTIGTDLESIGSNLAEGGFLNGFGLAVEALTQMLSLTNDLLEFFNKLPAPVKDMVSALVEARVALAVLRKFNVGDTLFAGEGKENARRFFNPKNASRIRLNEVLIEQENLSRGEGAASGRKSRRINKELPAAVAEQNRATQRVVDLERTGTATEEELVAAKDRQLALSDQVQRLTQAQVEQARIQLQALNELADIERVKTEASAAATEAEVEQIALRNNYVIPTSANKGKALDSEGLAASIGAKKGPNGQYVRDYEVENKAAEARAAAATSAVEADAQETAATGSRMGALASRATVATAVASETVAGAGSALKGLAGGLLEMLGGFSGIAFAALIFAPEIISGVQSAAEALAKNPEAEAAAGLANTHFKRSELTKFRRAYEQREREARLAGEKGEFIKAGQIGGSTPGGAPKGFNAYEDAYAKLEDAQQKALSTTGRASFLPSDVVNHQLEALEELTPGTNHYRKALADLRSNARSADVGTKERKALMKQIDVLESKNLNASSDITSFFKQYNALADKLLEAYVQNLGTLVQSGFATEKDIHRYISASLFKGIRDLGSGKSAVQAKGVETLGSVAEALNSAPSENLQRALSSAETQKDRYAAYRKYFQVTGKQDRETQQRFKSLKSQLSTDVEKTEQTISKYEAEGKGLAVTPDQAKHHNLTPGSPKELEERKNLEELKQRKHVANRHIRDLSKAQRVVEEKLEDLEREQEQALLTERLGVLGERGQITEARIGGQHPVAQARAGLANADRARRITEQTKGASPEQERQAILAVLNARETLRQALKQEAEGLSSAVEALAVARANGDPVLEAQAAVKHAESELAHAQNQTERDQALADLINAQHKFEESQVEIVISGIELSAARSQNPVTQARDQIRVAQEKLATAHGAAATNQAMIELIEARHSFESAQVEVALSAIEVEESETENPVKQARDQVRAARLRLKSAHGGAAKNQAKAELNNSLRNQREVTAQTQIENVEFDASIGKYTTDQQIAAYTRLLHTLKLGRDAKRSLIEKIHSLQEEASGSLELTVGNIALPTLYDIKRAVQGGISGGVPQAGSYNDYSTQTSTYHIHGDQKEIERALDNTQRRNNRAAKRSAGVG